MSSPSEPRSPAFGLPAAPESVPFRPTTTRFWSAYAVQMRPYLLFVSGITGWAGLSFSVGIGPARMVAALVASFFGYGFGQALTDCFQGDTDALSSPYRPLVRGVVRRGDVLAASLAGLTLCTVLFALANPWTLAAGAGAVAGLLAYTPCKRHWWAGPPCNAAVVWLLFLMGAIAGDAGTAYVGDAGTAAGGSGGFAPAIVRDVGAAGGGGFAPAIARAAGAVGFGAASVAVFFGYMHFVLTGYFKDIEADRATGYVTLPVRFGRRAAAVAADIVAVLTIAAAAVSAALAGGAATAVPAALAGGAVASAQEAIAMGALPVPSGMGATGAVALGMAAVLAGGGALLRSQILLHGVRTDAEAFRPIVPGLHGYLLVLEGIILARHPEWAVGLVPFHALFALVLARRPERRQV